MPEPSQPNRKHPTTRIPQWLYLEAAREVSHRRALDPWDKSSIASVIDELVSQWKLAATYNPRMLDLRTPSDLESGEDTLAPSE